MIESIASSDHVASTSLRVGIGFSPQPDAVWSVVQAAAIARSRFGAGKPHLAFVRKSLAFMHERVYLIVKRIAFMVVAIPNRTHN